MALVSLAFVLYGAISYGFSTPVETVDTLRNAFVIDADERARAVVVPVSDPRAVASFANGALAHGHAADVIAFGVPGGMLPMGSENVSYARVLAYVEPNATGDYEPDILELHGVPMPAPRAGFQAPTNDTNDTNETQDAHGVTFCGKLCPDTLVLNVTELAQGGTGFLVKRDNERDAFFVPSDDVIGKVARIDPVSRLVMLFAGGSSAFMLAALSLVMTHTPPGRAGVDLRACRECRSEVAPADPFCVRCGAWLQSGRS